jgi:GntR family transcriptional repressor for pyruvate dehydrogenase complex
MGGRSDAENPISVSLPARPQRVNLTRQCVHSIRQYIEAHHLGSGDRLPSLHEWAEQLGVSVVVVREAFRALEALGVVEIQQGRGLFLRPEEETDFLQFLAFRHAPDQFTVQEVFEARAMLDLVVLEACIARADRAVIEALEEMIGQMASDPRAVEVGSPLHFRFHQVMLEASGNRFLISIGLPLLNTFWALDHTGPIEFLQGEAVDEVAAHAAYVDAIKRRDFSRTRELVDKHLIGLCSKHGVFPLLAAASGTRQASPTRQQGVRQVAQAAR